MAVTVDPEAVFVSPMKEAGPHVTRTRIADTARMMALTMVSQQEVADAWGTGVRRAPDRVRRPTPMVLSPAYRCL